MKISAPDRSWIVGTMVVLAIASVMNPCIYFRTLVPLLLASTFSISVGVLLVRHSLSRGFFLTVTGLIVVFVVAGVFMDNLLVALTPLYSFAP